MAAASRAQGSATAAATELQAARWEASRAPASCHPYARVVGGGDLLIRRFAIRVRFLNRVVSSLNVT
eukprot:4280388-Prymnesium_polylepis.1